MKSIIPFAARVISALIAIISTYYLTRILGVELFGVYSAMLSATFFFNLFTDWGFNLYGAQMLAGFPTHQEKESFLKGVLTLKLILSVIFSLVYFIMALFVFKNGLLYLLGLPLILLSFLNPEWVCRGTMLPHFVGFRQLIFSGLNIIGFILIFYAKFPPILGFILNTLNTILSFLIIIAGIKRKTKLSFTTAPFKELNPMKLLKRSSLYFYGFLLNNMNYVSGVILLAIFLNSKATGAYSSYYNILTNVITPVVITYSLFAPKLAVLNDEGVLKKYYTVIGYIILAGFVFFLNFKFFYNLFYPSSFTFQPEITIIVALVFVFFCAEYLFVINSIFLNEPKSYFLINLLGLVINFSLSFYFIFSKQFSVYNSYVCLLLSQIAMCVYAIGKWPKLIFNFSFKDSLFCVASLLIILIAHFSLSIFYVIFISFVIISVAAVKVILLLKNLY